MTKTITQKMKKMLVSFVLVLGAGSMGCSKLQFSEADLPSIDKLISGFGGDIYSGKIYVHRLDNEKCADGTNVASVIIEDRVGTYTLVRESCYVLSPAPVLNPDSVRLIGDDQLEYAENIYNKEYDINEGGSEPGQPPSVPGEPTLPPPSVQIMCEGYSGATTAQNAITSEEFASVKIYMSAGAYSASVHWNAIDNGQTNELRLEGRASSENGQRIELYGANNLFQLKFVAEMLYSSDSALNVFVGNATLSRTNSGEGINVPMSCQYVRTGGVDPAEPTQPGGPTDREPQSDETGINDPVSSTNDPKPPAGSND